MTRQEAHFDAMLRHLGAMYYKTVQGAATPSDVARALARVEREAARRAGGTPSQPARGHGQRTGRWRVRDVMTAEVIAVDRHAPSTRIARLLSDHHINALPVVTGEHRVAGVVSEADLLRTQHRPVARTRGRFLARRPRATRADYTAAQLMTTPAVTIHPDAPLGAAARRMTADNLTLLPVVDDRGELIGVVSRRDLLTVFLRPDDDLVAEVRQVLADVALIDTDTVTVTAHEGAVALTGQVERQEQIPLAVHLAGEVDGVLAVTDKLTAPPVPAGQHS